MIRTLSPFLFTTLVIAVSAGLLTGCEESGEEGEGEGPERQQISSPKNEVLMEATSPFEDLIEFAEAGDAAGMDESIADARQRIEDAREVLSVSELEEIESLLADIDEARSAGENQTIAMLSLEAYRAVVSSFEDAALVVPKAVSLLDYAGFKVHAIAVVDNPDWTTIDETTQEAVDLWQSIEGWVEEKGLRDAMNTTIDGMQEAAAARDARMAAFAANIDLDLVDLLENYFASSAATP